MKIVTGFSLIVSSYNNILSFKKNTLTHLDSDNSEDIENKNTLQHVYIFYQGL